MKRLGAVLGLFAALGALALLLAAGPLLKRESFSKSQNLIKDDFFRFTAKYLVDGTEPLDFDVVVNCLTEITRYGDKSSSLLSVRWPALYAKRTRANHAVMVAVPQVCALKETWLKKEYPPENLLPIAVWFDSADNLGLGLGYWTESTYDNPRARLKFLGATLAKATRLQWEASREAVEAENLVKRTDYIGLQNPDQEGYYANWVPGARRLGNDCHGAARIRLSEEARALARALWPERRPQYWSLSITESPSPERSRLMDIIHKLGGGTVEHMGPQTAHWDKLVPLQLERKRQASPHPVEYYPLRNDRGYPFLSQDLDAKEWYFKDVVYSGGANKGFVYCYSMNESDKLMNYYFPSKARGHVGLWPFAYRVDGQIALPYPPIANALLIPPILFERDEYVFRIYTVTLG